MGPSFTKLSFQSSNREDAKAARQDLIKVYGDHDAADADAIIALGGDGFLLETLTRNMTLVKRGLPVYGMNRGTVGFLMNDFKLEGLPQRLIAAETATVHPLKMTVTGEGGKFFSLAFNEVALLRQTHQAAHIRIVIDGKERLERLIADGVLVATPAGSTAYNLSAHGPVLPLNADILALTPISAFRPRRWRGALLKAEAQVEFEVINPAKRPVSATADNKEYRNIHHVSISQDKTTSFTLMFDTNQGLDEKILREQFAT